MNKVTYKAIEQLLETEDTNTLSIYMPTHHLPSSGHIAEDKIRYKNLLKSGREALQKVCSDDGVRQQIIDQLEQLYDDDTFWQHTTQGLAVFCSPAGVSYFHLPLECDEYVSVGDRYDVAPLLVIAAYDQPYYILALATKNPQIFYGDMYEVGRLEIDLPKSPEEALNIDELYSNSRTDRAGGHGAGAKAHGQGDSRQAGQEERLKFFRLIDDALLSSKLIDGRLPILLAGTDDEVSGYRESSRLKQILKAQMNGNCTDVTPHELHTQSWPIVRELYDQNQASHIENIANLIGTGRVSLQSEEIAIAAEQGRTEMLLLGMLAKTKDSIRDANDTITKIVFSEHYTVNSINKVVRSVFDRGGRVIGIFSSDMPNNAFEAALYRY